MGDRSFRLDVLPQTGFHHVDVTRSSATAVIARVGGRYFVHGHSTLLGKCSGGNLQWGESATRTQRPRDRVLVREPQLGVSLGASSLKYG